ncbi:MAG: hypothetical protein ACOCUP_01905 [bacterium]
MIKHSRFFFIILILIPNIIFCQHVWENTTYPDEEGYIVRIAPMVERLADTGFGRRSLAPSRCPDTGLPVYTWALEGETIISPYTGRAYKQGPVGYFGPKARNEKGEIIAFGGDPLKKDLPPTIAAMLMDPGNERARAYVSIPGNMRQQYHFACKNWARFYPLLADTMGDEWKKEFYSWVGTYTESRRPSDGYRESLPLSTPHNLIGQPGYLLGGNPKDGGTENHKTMWRTSALVYSQLFPDTCTISGYRVEKAKELTREMIVNYIDLTLRVGNGEYDSQVYYPHSIEAFLNLYDFSAEHDIKEIAKFILDYYFVTYGLKVIDGAIAGAQKRGYLPTGDPSEMEVMQWAFFDNSSADMSEAITTIQQSTTTYRPNKIIWDIVKKNVELPYEAKMSRPFYHMDHPHAFAETFYCSETYALGNIQMTIVDNPNQQMVWSLAAKGKEGPLCFSGGHPMRKSTSGHSPYTQTLQSKGTLILLTAPTRKVKESGGEIAPNYSHSERPNLWHLPESEQGDNFQVKNRQKYAKEELRPLKELEAETPDAYEKFWNENMGSASSWFYYPAKLNPERIGENWYFEANNSFIAVIPLSASSFQLGPNPGIAEKIKGSAGKFFRDYHLLIFPGKISGYIIETGEKAEFNTLTEFDTAIRKKVKTDLSKKKLLVKHSSLSGDEMEMKYFPEGLRCGARINGKTVNWDDFTHGAVYESPYLKVKDGKIIISNGTEGYSVEIIDGVPVYKEF